MPSSNTPLLHLMQLTSTTYLSAFAVKTRATVSLAFSLVISVQKASMCSKTMKISKRVNPLHPSCCKPFKPLDFSLLSSQRTMLPPLGACVNWRRYVTALKLHQDLLLYLFFMMLILRWCANRVDLMRKHLQTTKRDSEKMQ